MIDLRCSIRVVGGRPVLALDGIADLASIPVLHDSLRKFVDQHPGCSVAVDLDGASVLDDAALGLLLGAAATARSRDGDLTVVCRDPRLVDRLEVTRFDRAVTVDRSLAAFAEGVGDDALYDQGMGEEKTS